MDGHHADAVAVLLEDWRFRRDGVLGRHAQLLDEAAERDPAARLELPRELRDVERVRQYLFSTRAEREPDVRARRAEQLVQRLRHRHVVATAMEPLEDGEGFGDRSEMADFFRRLAIEHGGHAERVQRVTPEALRCSGPETMRPLEQRLVADREERSSERREHRQLVVRPFDRRKRGANGLHLFALVERLAADQHVRDPARLERLDVRAGDVVLPADETPEQEADMLRGDVHGRFAAALRHLPPALAQHPLDEGGDGPRQRLLDGCCADVSPLVRLGDRQRHDGRLTGQCRTMGSERDVGRLERQRVAGHDRTERVVHARLDPGDAAEAGIEVQGLRAERGQPVADFAVDADVRAAEAVDRLLRIADEKQRAGPGTRAPPVRLVVVVGREQQEDLRLERIGVLELVDEDPLEARLKSAAHLRVVARRDRAPRGADRGSRAPRPGSSARRSGRWRRAGRAGAGPRDRHRRPAGTDRDAP